MILFTYFISMKRMKFEIECLIFKEIYQGSIKKISRIAFKIFDSIYFICHLTI